ncbi:hypothetical protein [Candidatus Carsonella ruddii]|uniref:Uncharacterized protein n=1 Tax=Candidatus Carsonella ruddii PC isolate NHV TaxID=1202540 RepID=J3YQU0_CARRU|nr:hypothetical protein [Candidatus Carsonella ruddii]AFP84353.1 hypothetical protein A357_0154 [Candidatus Carsonella ruddii PC isolate NHV]
MKIKLIFFFENKNFTSNFFNYLIQINLKIILVKFYLYSSIIHKKILFINDRYYKINQFVKSSKKCLNIKKIIFYKNCNYLYLYNFKFNNKIKFYKSFIFIFKLKKYCIFLNFKKKNYTISILNNFLLLKIK